MNTIERIQDMVGHLVAGWHEHIEYAVVIEGVTEKRGRMAYQPALIVQLENAGCELGGIGRSGGNPSNKPSSRPPGNTAALHLLDHIEARAWEWYNVLYKEVLCRPMPRGKQPLALLLTDIVKVAEKAAESHSWTIARLSRDIMGWQNRARVVLGYNKPDIRLADVVCGDCGGTLIVASDASSDVRCDGTEETPSCGVVYPRTRWIEMIV